MATLPTFLVIAVALLATTLLAGRLPGGGMLWDLLNGLGVLACVLLVHLAWASTSPARQPALGLHTILGVLATVAVALHALGLIVADPTVIEYLKLEAPLYMLVGIATALLLLALTVSSFVRPRLWVFRRYDRFRRWHRIGWFAVMVGTAWHVLGSGFYLGSRSAIASFALVFLVLPAAFYAARRRDLVPDRSFFVQAGDGARLALSSTVFVLVFTVMRNL